MKFVFMHIKNKKLTQQNKNKMIDIGKSQIVVRDRKEIGKSLLKQPKYEIIESNTINKLSIKDKLSDIKSKLKEEYRKNKEIQYLNERWLDVMFNCKFINAFKKTFTLVNLKHENYGFSCRILIPDGYCIDDLDNKTTVIQNNVGCTFVLEKFSNKRYANAKFILIENCNKIPFEPVEVEPYQVCAGVDEGGHPVIFNMNIEPMVLIAGATRMGKNGCIDHAIPSWIYYCSEDDIHLYLFQFAKGDLGKYQKCKQVKCFSMSDLDKLLEVLNELKTEMSARMNMMSSMLNNFKGDNLYDYNKLNPDKKLPYIYIIIDEFMDIANSEGDKESSKVKAHIISILQSIAEYGGALGVNYIILHQKPEKSLMPTFLKNQSNTRICFGFKDEVCGRIVLGEDRGKLVTTLQPRKAYYISNSGEGYLYTTNLRNKNGSSRILNYIKPSMTNKKESSNVHHVSDCKVAKNDKYSKSKDSEVQFKEKVSQIKIQMDKINKHSKNSEDTPQSKGKIIEFPNQYNQDNSHHNLDATHTSNPTSQNKKYDIKITQSNNKSTSNKPIQNPNIDSNFSKVNIPKVKSKEDVIRENIKKIPNFVPYEPPKTNAKITDETDIAFKQSEKYRKDIKNENDKKGDY
ncbi:FtsK/SpoIIIE domain-containing protein [Clostridium botulinum]|uniref:FtsK/SpoIIIE domain-containing protein n=2 Tax=Clostridium botulinum TaxID=1491 RepID=UPI00057F6851|nr:FtsK/SpoIIIE domain-containing protein [Clostridium botulinum]KOA94898.1 cell division protein FtsK [Clostridium botulinum]MCD3252401.1 cell division protein FtsK [Clostridium botulinum C/D]MCD3277935.1 cell division protein FtsK [Clostridium botulinum C/D]MCD3282113.1 cell division protein FtsK [Clostridium botulinum C/D]MCD3355861.1 cell division protein FtsK [Clostridium botulinum C/D]